MSYSQKFRRDYQIEYSRIIVSELVTGPKVELKVLVEKPTFEHEVKYLLQNYENDSNKYRICLDLINDHFQNICNSPDDYKIAKAVLITTIAKEETSPGKYFLSDNQSMNNSVLEYAQFLFNKLNEY